MADFGVKHDALAAAIAVAVPIAAWICACLVAIGAEAMR